MELIAENRKVWIPDHPTEAYLPGRVEEALDGGKLLVVDESGEKFEIAAKEAQSVDPACLTGVDDLLSLGDFTEAALLHNVRVRYSEDDIYTGVGSPILISLNPYQHIPGLYSAEKQRAYRQAGGARAAGAPGPPVHLYSVADAAFQTMLNEQVNQSIIISGESGAGKTEATKRILAYLAERQKTGAASGGPGGSSAEGVRRTVEQQVLDANPVLEAFGNAKTVRNDNSSRFGKFVEVEFDSSGKLLSAQICNYLLEKCRIVTQQPEERNYHIFYQLCAGFSEVPGLPSSLRLKESQDFEYTRTCDSINGVDDAIEFSDMINCMASLGFSTEERDSALRIVSAVLHLGNLTFSPCTRDQQDGVQIDDASQIPAICELLGIDEAQTIKVLEYRSLEDPLTKKTIFRPHDPQSSSHTRHSMSKVVYTRLFDWLVWRINQSMSVPNKAMQKELRRIGLLDIYGFEVFEWNSFEQLCINFANEKLQQHFNNHMFTLEQQMYTREGITWSHITFQDNQHIIDALAKGKMCVFSLVDSECSMPSATDNTLLAKIHSNFKNSGVIYKPSLFACSDFAVKHYAGEVVYSTETFLEKNTDKLHSDVVNLMKASKLDLLKRLFTEARFAPEASQKQPAAATARGGRAVAQRRPGGAPEAARNNMTVSYMFREQLDKLVEDLNKTNPRYVRCIKPNANKQPREFDSIDVLRQLRCAGMLESIRIRRAGYAVRRPFKEFFSRFRVLAPHLAASGADPDYRNLCQRLVTEVEQKLRRDGAALDEKPWQMGQSRVFMKEDLERHFERLLVESAKNHVIEIQRRWRGFSQGRHYRSMQTLAKETQCALRTFQAVQSYHEAKRKRDAVLTLQAALHGFLAQKAAARHRFAATNIQRIFLGWRCRRRIGKIRGKAAADKIRKLREEEEKQEALQRARKEAQDKDRELEAMRQELEAKQKAAEVVRVVEQPAVASGKETELEEENKRLLERLAAAEAAAAEGQAAMEAVAAMASVSSNDPGRDEQVRELEAQVERLQGANASLTSELERSNAECSSLRDCVDEANIRLKEAQRKEQARAAVGGGAVTAAAAGGGDALGALRSEILARIGEGGGGQNLDVTGPGMHHHLMSSLVNINNVNATMQSALRPINESSPLNQPVPADGVARPLAAAVDASNARDPSGRKTNDCQREIFEQLRKQFTEVQDKPQEQNDFGTDQMDSYSVEQVRILEDEVRRLRRENASLKTSALSAQEETTESANEAAGLLQQMSRLQAELEDLKYRNKSEVEDWRQQLEDTSETLRRQVEDMRRLDQRAQEAEEKAAAYQSQASQIETDVRGEKDKNSQLEQGWLDLDRQVSILQKEKAEMQSRLEAALQEQGYSKQEMRREREQLQAKDHELVNLKRTFDDLMSAHVPMEELQRWKNQAETYKKHYEQAMRYNKEMTSAVGCMTQASSERSADISELEQTNAMLKRDQERRAQELKMAELEKEDLQKQLDNLQSSCSYFQTKYKNTASELRNVQREHLAANESLGRARAQNAELQETLRSHAGIARHQQQKQQQQQQHAHQHQHHHSQQHQMAAAASRQPHGREQQTWPSQVPGGVHMSRQH